MVTKDDLDFLAGMIDHDFSPIADQNRAGEIFAKIRIELGLEDIHEKNKVIDSQE